MVDDESSATTSVTTSIKSDAQLYGENRYSHQNNTDPGMSHLNGTTTDDNTTSTTTTINSKTNSESWIQHEDLTTTDTIISPSTSKSSADTSSSLSSSSLRSMIGTVSIEVSQLINDNIIVARSLSILSISALVIYAFTQTPLFFRYRNVADIPSHYFQKRKTITGRLMICHHHHNTIQNTPRHGSTTTAKHQQSLLNQQQQPRQGEETAVTCYIRHLSPFESLLSNNWLRWYWKLSSNNNSTGNSVSTTGSASNHNQPNSYHHPNNSSVVESISELIKVQIAGIQYPQLNVGNTNNNNVDSILRHTTTTTSNNGNNSNIMNSKYSEYNTVRNWNNATPENIGLKYQQQHASTTTPLFGQTDWLQKLSQNQCLVRCQFLGRQVPNYSDSNSSSSNSGGRNKRPIPGMAEVTTNMIDATIPIEDRLQQQLAIVKIYYHPDSSETESATTKSFYQRFKNLFRRRKDLGEAMIKNGHAVVSDGGLFTTTSTTTTRIIDTNYTTTTNLDHHHNNNNTSRRQRPLLQHDLQYMDQLSRLEYQAAQSYRGIWNVPHYRTVRSDIIDEIQFQQQSTMIQKLFRYIRGG